jgi:argonaute-like protein implicated in RNA metabolism and viral defense
MGNMAYTLGNEFDYTAIAGNVPDCDAVLAVVPNPDNVPHGVDDAHPEFKKHLGGDGIPTQMVTEDTLSSSDGGTLGNVAVGLIGGAGGIPWRVSEMPGDADCFIGLDATYDHDTGQHIGASANVVYADGTILASQSRMLQAGEKFEVEDIVEVVKNLLKIYVEEENTTPQHIVIHQDGKFFEDTEELTEKLSPLNVDVDLVEVRKSGAPRVVEKNGSFGIADKGVGFRSTEEEHAVLATTGGPEIKDRRGIGTPDPLQIIRRAGDTPVETLAEQVYWLSEAHIGSISSSTRLPITTYYADKCADQAMKGYIVSDEVVRGVPYI